MPTSRTPTTRSSVRRRRGRGDRPIVPSSGGSGRVIGGDYSRGHAPSSDARSTSGREQNGCSIIGSGPQATRSGAHVPRRDHVQRAPRHTNFSFLDGASPSEDLVARAVELGLDGLAVTDHQGLYGAVRFVSAAQEAGLRPIVGMEVELLDAAVPDPDGVVVPHRRRRRRGSPGPVVEAGLLSGMASVAGAAGGRCGSAAEGRPVRPASSDCVRLAIASRGARTCAACATRAGPAPRPAGPRPDRLSQPVPAGQRRASGRHQGRAALHARAAGRACRGSGGALRLPPRRDRAAAAGRRSCRGRRGGASAAPSAIPVTGLGAASSSSCSTTCCPTTTGWSPRRPTWPSGSACRSWSPTTPTTRGRRTASCQDVLVAIRHGLTLEESAHLRRPNGEYHLKSARRAGAPCRRASRARAIAGRAARLGGGAAHGRGARRPLHHRPRLRALPLPGLPGARAARRPSATWSGSATRAPARATTP